MRGAALCSTVAWLAALVLCGHAAPVVALDFAEHKLTASDGAPNDYFGLAVALSADGQVALVGAPHHDTGGANSRGAAYVFVRSAAGWVQHQQLAASDGLEGDNFGSAVALSVDGQVALIGALGDSLEGGRFDGSAYVFVRTGGAWAQAAKLTPAEADTAGFFGISVALSATGGVALVGAPRVDVDGHAEQGAAYVFVPALGGWASTRLVAPDGAADDRFGTAVALSADGQLALIGVVGDDSLAVEDQGSAHVFACAGGVWTPQQKLVASGGGARDRLGMSVSLSGMGEEALVGAVGNNGVSEGPGAAYLFTREGGTWAQRQRLTGSSGATDAAFGRSVALSLDGRAALVGAYGDVEAGAVARGSADLFVGLSDTLVHNRRLVASDGASDDRFGMSVALDGDGHGALVGAHMNSLRQGAAYAFDLPGPLVITEVNWSTWASQVQITDVTGGSVVQVYYDCGGGDCGGVRRRGPFVLWDNRGGGHHSSISYPNILAQIAALDGGVGTPYEGTSGALELFAQDASHWIQAAVRTSNTGLDGYNSRTFPALADVNRNAAVEASAGLLIMDLSNDETYRPSVVLFNPSVNEVSVEVELVDGSGSPLATVLRRLAGYQMDVVTDELRVPSFSHGAALVGVRSGFGRVMASGQTASFGAEDPAAHLAVHTELAFANSPEPEKFLTEVNWATPWRSEVQLIDVVGGAVVRVWYDRDNSGLEGARYGPFVLWDNSAGPRGTISFANILAKIDSLDGDPLHDYEKTSGALELRTQDRDHLIQAAVRTHDQKGHSRTFPAFGGHPANTAAIKRPLLIPNMSDNEDYRCSVVLFNPTEAKARAQVQVLDNDGSKVGAEIPRELGPYEMNCITTELRDLDFSHATVRVEVTEGDACLLATGQTAHNISQDPAGHIAVQEQ